MRKKSFAIIGLGKFGMSVARTLAQAGCEVLVVDNDNESVQEISSVVTYALCADVTEAGVMESIGLSNVEVAIIGISESMEASIIATIFAKEAGVPYVLAKATNKLHGQILKKVGADEVTYPEKDTGVRVAKNFLSGNFKDYFELSEEVGLVELQIPKVWEGKTLIELNLRGKYGVNVVAIKRGDKVTIEIDPNKPLKAGEILGMVGKVEVLSEMKDDYKI